MEKEKNYIISEKKLQETLKWLESRKESCKGNTEKEKYYQGKIDILVELFYMTYDV